ncbi:MAG: MlaD family protein [Chitinivibrionales bacterium]
MKRANAELLVGASIFFALFILIAGVMWLKEASLASKMVEYTVLFPNVGALQKGDPVNVNGVKRGHVGSMYLRDEVVAVILKVEKSVGLTDSSNVVVQNVGLMGERAVGIQISGKGKRLSPNSSQDTTFMYGRFDSGIAEAMGMLGNVLADVEVLLGNVSTMFEQTIGDTQFVTLFSDLSGRLDTITFEVEDLINQNKHQINRSVDNIHTVTTDVKKLITYNSSHIDTIMANGSLLTQQALTLTGRIDSISVSLKDMVDKIQNGEGSLGQLLQDEVFYTKLKTMTSELDTLLTEVNEDGLKLRIKLGFGRKKNRN